MIRLFYKVLMLATVLLELEACSGLQRYLHTDPLTPQEHVALGEAYQAQQMMDLASREFQIALRQKRDYVPALVGLGNIAFEKNRLQNAEDYYRRALEAVPDHPAANNNLAMVYLLRGARLDKAEQFAKRALAHGGAIQPYALDTLAKIYLRQGRYPEAESALKEAEDVTPAENSALKETLIQSRRELSAAYLQAK
jgi:tetratricopeptide (TPR) repeat protein